MSPTSCWRRCPFIFFNGIMEAILSLISNRLCQENPAVPQCRSIYGAFGGYGVDLGDGDTVLQPAEPRCPDILDQTLLDRARLPLLEASSSPHLLKSHNPIVLRDMLPLASGQFIGYASIDLVSLSIEPVIDGVAPWLFRPLHSLRAMALAHGARPSASSHDSGLRT